MTDWKPGMPAEGGSTEGAERLRWTAIFDRWGKACVMVAQAVDPSCPSRTLTAVDAVRGRSREELRLRLEASGLGGWERIFEEVSKSKKWGCSWLEGPGEA